MGAAQGSALRTSGSRSSSSSVLLASGPAHQQGSLDSKQLLAALSAVARLHLTQLTPASAGSLVLLQPLITKRGGTHLFWFEVQLYTDLERNPGTASEN